ncbi:MAG: hypothetical protein HOI66_23965 [Verrucomicrobia bacterium]|nr:hypothetical protein [Verrucomicrobiota bacterium]
MPPLKLLFDECCSKRLARVLMDVYLEDCPKLETKHLTDELEAGTEDQVWVKNLSEKDGWIVVSADRGKDPKKAKLPHLCIANKTTSVLFTSYLHTKTFFYQKHALLSVFPDLLLLPQVKKGTVVKLGARPVSKGGGEVPRLTVENTHLRKWVMEHEGGDL